MNTFHSLKIGSDGVQITAGYSFFDLLARALQHAAEIEADQMQAGGYGMSAAVFRMATDSEGMNTSITENISIAGLHELAAAFRLIAGGERCNITALASLFGGLAAFCSGVSTIQSAIAGFEKLVATHGPLETFGLK